MSRKGWRECKLGDVAEITSSKRIFYSEYTENGIPFWRSKEVIEIFHKQKPSTELYISQQRYHEIKKKYGVPTKDDILLTSVGTIGIPYLVKEDDKFYFKDGNLTWIKNINQNILNPKFLKLWITSSTGKDSLATITIGSTQEAITIIGLKDLSIILPPITIQDQVVSILSSLDDKIDLLHGQNKTLEALAETLFRQWFVEEADKQIPVSDCIDFNPQRVISKKLTAPYLEMSKVNTDTFHPIDWYDRKFTSGMKFINRDTLLARITPCLENGKAAYITFLEDKQTGWGSTEFIVLRPKENIHPLFAYALTKNHDFRDYAEGCLEGSSGRQRVNVGYLMNFEVNLLTKGRINGFNRVMEAIEPKLVNNFAGIRTLEQLRNILLPRLMSGKITANSVQGKRIQV
jgi:type I restriction enzyme S subunit